jgi:hypothetical protein
MLPRVSEILKAVGLADDFANIRDPRYAQRGQAVHRWLQWHGEGGDLICNREQIHPDLRPGVDAYLEFCERYRHRAVYSERMLVHDKLGFIGHLDREGFCADEPVVIDWKFTDSPDLRGGRYQLAAYALLVDAQQGQPQAPLRCLLVALGKNGRPTVHDLTDEYARTVFAAAVVVYRARLNNGRH